jgi:sugar lactone lactonase YvrE
MGTSNAPASSTKYGGDVGGLSVTITGLTNETTYYIWIKAKNSAYTSGFSPATNGVPSAWYVSTLAGSTKGYADGTGAAAQFDYPFGVAVDSAGYVYVADEYNNRIRKITPGGEVTTLAGNGGRGDYDGTNARFFEPSGVAVDSAGYVYVADRANHRIRKITPGGVVTTLAGSSSGIFDGTGTAAEFFYPSGVAVDSDVYVYFADTRNNRIRRITPEGVVTTLRSIGGFTNGNSMPVGFYDPYGIAVDSAGYVYVADTDNHRIRKITPEGVVTTLAGSTQGYTDGTGTAAQFDHPSGMAVDSDGYVYVADSWNNRIRRITPGGVVTTLAGSGPSDGSPGGYADGTGTAAQFYRPTGVAVDSAGNVYVADYCNYRIRKMTR